MPGVTLHFVLARKVVHRWRASGTPAPFDLDDAEQHNAFLQGAIGPDIGYIPGGERVLSELSHCVRTGELARTLIGSARTPVERAFAWGWLTHVIGDREIHPLVGRGVGEYRYGSSDVFVDGSSDPLTHLQVELGLDCWFAAREPEARRVRLRPVFDRDSIVFLERAYTRTYGLPFGREVFLTSHRVTGRRVGQSLATIGIISTLMESGRGGFALAALRCALRAAYRSSSLRGIPLAYLNPVAPTEWLVDRVTEAIPRHADQFMAEYDTGARDLEDWNLDTGARLDDEAGHPGTLQAHESLRRLRARIEDREEHPAARPHPARVDRPTPAVAEA